MSEDTRIQRARRLLFQTETNLLPTARLWKMLLRTNLVLKYTAPP